MRRQRSISATGRAREIRAELDSIRHRIAEMENGLRPHATVQHSGRHARRSA